MPRCQRKIITSNPNPAQTANSKQARPATKNAVLAMTESIKWDEEATSRFLAAGTTG